MGKENVVKSPIVTASFLGMTLIFAVSQLRERWTCKLVGFNNNSNIAIIFLVQCKFIPPSTVLIFEKIFGEFFTALSNIYTLCHEIARYTSMSLFNGFSALYP